MLMWDVNPYLTEMLFFRQQVEAQVILGDRNSQATVHRMNQAMRLQAVSDLKKAIGEANEMCPLVIQYLW